MDFSHGVYDSPGITVDSWRTGERSNTVYSERFNYYWSFNTIHRLKYAIFGSTHKFWWNTGIDQQPRITATNSLHTAPGRIGIVAAQARGWWDNLRIRKYVEPEPSTSLGAEECKAYDYVLRLSNLGGNAWSVYLARSSDSNVERLSNLTIWFHDGEGVSKQLQVIEGAYTQTSGSLCSLPAGGTLYIALEACCATPFPPGSSTIVVRLKSFIQGERNRGGADDQLHRRLGFVFGLKYILRPLLSLARRPILTS